MWRREDVVKKLRDEQGERSLRKYAVSIGCSVSYLSEVYNGTRDPGEKLLNHLGLECQKIVTVTYVPKRRWR